MLTSYLEVNPSIDKREVGRSKDLEAVKELIKNRYYDTVEELYFTMQRHWDMEPDKRDYEDGFVS